MVLITGATGAIGKEIARQLAAKGYNLILTYRSEQKGEELRREITNEFHVAVRLLQLNLADSRQVRKAAASLEGIPLQGIINNAGVMNYRYILSVDNKELTLTVNFYNTRLLNQLLLRNLRRGAAIVFTTSTTRMWYPFQELKYDIFGPDFGRVKTYALSKKMITLHAQLLSEKFGGNGIRVNCADPGVVDTPMLKMGEWYDFLTDIFFRPFCTKPDKAAKAAVNAFISTENGMVFTPSGKKNIAVRCKDKNDFTHI